MKYMIGTMIETPRAAVTADEIAQEAEFFSFGTNDLTQMTYGFSRDDVGRILDSYFEKKILESDPFARLDQNGVGKLVKMAVESAVRPVRRSNSVSAASMAATCPRLSSAISWSELCILLAVPRADCASGCCTGGLLSIPRTKPQG